MIFKRLLRGRDQFRPQEKPLVQATLTTRSSSSLAYSWIITGQLGIGPMPRNSAHWDQLERDGFRSRFSCCYPQEHVYTSIPTHWKTEEVSLPDHRSQEDLSISQLTYALNRAISMLNDSDGALYLHCFAGQERSVLMAVGILAMVQKVNLFDSLDIVRQCHKNARPLYGQLDLLEQALKEINQT